jgi:predicted MFS family arabinose efflux permease
MRIGGRRPSAGVADDRLVRAARNAVFAVFFGNGFLFASWAARIPQVRAELQISPGVLGIILLFLAAGSTLGTPLSGLIVSWLGETRTVIIMSLAAAAGMALVAAGTGLGIPLVAAGLFVLGFGSGTWDVAMNVQGAAVEQALGRAILPRFHAAWSIGTVTGAGLGAAMVALSVPVPAHLLAVAVIVAGTVPVAARRFLPAHRSALASPAEAGAARAAPAEAAPAQASPAQPSRNQASPAPGGRSQGSPNPPGRRPSRWRGALAAWTEPRTLLIGLFVLCMAFTEGTGNDWLSLGVIDGYHTAAALGTLTFAAFLAAMTTGRWFGPRLIDGYGRVPVLRCCVAVALAGLLLIELGRVLPAAVAGAVLLGLGTSLGFPVGLSSAADDPRYAATRVSTAASIGYLAFLAGPPAVGFLADQVGVLRSLSVAGVLLIAAFFLCRATAPLRPPPVTGPPPPGGPPPSEVIRC